MCSLFDQALNDLGDWIYGIDPVPRDYNFKNPTGNAASLRPGYPGKDNPERVFVVTNRPKGHYDIELMRWGLVRYNATRKPRKKDNKIAPEPFNARGDNLVKSWGWLLESRRCAIPARAWAEKFGTKGMMDTAWFERADGQPMMFGGLHDTWERPDGTKLHSVAMVTTEPNHHLGEYHDRAPWVIPDMDTFHIWTDNERFDAEELQGLVQPADPDLIRVREIVKADTKMSRALEAEKEGAG